MLYILRLTPLLILFNLFLIKPAYPQDSMNIKSTKAAGFINLGDKKDSDINIELTKSLITYLSKAVNNRITSYKCRKLCGHTEFLGHKYIKY